MDELSSGESSGELHSQGTRDADLESDGDGLSALSSGRATPIAAFNSPSRDSPLLGVLTTSPSAAYLAALSGDDAESPLQLALCLRSPLAAPLPRKPLPECLRGPDLRNVRRLLRRSVLLHCKSCIGLTTSKIAGLSTCKVNNPPAQKKGQPRNIPFYSWSWELVDLSHGRQTYFCRGGPDARLTLLAV